MKKVIPKIILMLFFLGLVTFLVPLSSFAFNTKDVGENSSITFYGWVRNNYGVFLDEQPYAQSDDKIATNRTWARAYVDLNINDNIKFWTAIQFAYEPFYEVETGATSSLDPEEPGVVEDSAEEYSEYDNFNDIVREVYVEWTPSLWHSIKVGRQIAIWGEALTSRVGDVIHPDNSRFAFTFANLEDTRIPSWMVRGIHRLPLNSSFEWIVSPNLVEEKYRVTYGPNFATPASSTPGQRFAPYPEDRGDIPYYVPLNGTRYEYPEAWDDMRYGFRATTTLKGISLGVSYFHTQEYLPIIDFENVMSEYTPLAPGVFIPGVVDKYVLTYPDKDIYGIFGSMQLPWPGVVRAEAIYVPNQPFELMYYNGVTERDYVKYLFAYDLNSYLYFQWHKSASFDVTFEHTAEYISDNEDLMWQGYYHTTPKKFNPSYGLSISTTWLYTKFGTSLVAAYQPWGKSGMIMPVVTYSPSWFKNAFSFELKYVNVFGDNYYEGMGPMRDKDMVYLTTQFSF